MKIPVYTSLKAALVLEMVQYLPYIVFYHSSTIADITSVLKTAEARGRTSQLDPFPAGSHGASILKWSDGIPTDNMK